MTHLADHVLLAIGWSLTGTTNSPAPNLSFLYQTTVSEKVAPPSPPPNVHSGYTMEVGRPQMKPSAHRSRISQTSVTRQPTMDQAASSGHTNAPVMPPPNIRYSATPNDQVSTAEADLLLGLHSPYAVNASQSSPNPQNPYNNAAPPLQHNTAIPPPATAYDYNQSTPDSNQYFPNANIQNQGATMLTPFSDMMIESQDIDMLGSQGGFAFPGGDMIPWLEYLPQDVLNYFGEAPDDGTLLNPPGSGPPLDDQARPQ